jgi:hypothetical protein
VVSQDELDLEERQHLRENRLQATERLDAFVDGIDLVLHPY